VTGPITADGDGVVVAVKAVPGARRDGVAGVLGDRLKVRVSAPPEGGRANDAIRRLLAARLGVRVGRVEIVSGHAHPEKTLRVDGIGVGAARDALGL
jgi:uncharacterized protein (TIGR00251 family)